MHTLTLNSKLKFQNDYLTVKKLINIPKGIDYILLHYEDEQLSQAVLDAIDEVLFEQSQERDRNKLEDGTTDNPGGYDSNDFDSDLNDSLVNS